MKDFKTLSLKRNSVMDNLLSCHTDKSIEKQTSMLFHSQKWNLDAHASQNKKGRAHKKHETVIKLSIFSSKAKRFTTNRKF